MRVDSNIAAIRKRLLPAGFYLIPAQERSWIVGMDSGDIVRLCPHLAHGSKITLRKSLIKISACLGNSIGLIGYRFAAYVAVLMGLGLCIEIRKMGVIMNQPPLIPVFLENLGGQHIVHEYRLAGLSLDGFESRRIDYPRNRSCDMYKSGALANLNVAVVGKSLSPTHPHIIPIQKRRSMGRVYSGDIIRLHP